jgi:hypothetical protein
LNSLTLYRNVKQESAKQLANEFTLAHRLMRRVDVASFYLVLSR